MTQADPQFDMDRMLHRGRFTDRGDHADSKPKRGVRALGWGPEFTREDKFIYLLYFGWTVATIGWFVVFTTINLIWDVSDRVWGTWWLVYLIIGAVMAVFTTVWFLYGGFRDLLVMIGILKIARRDAFDDGTVVAHQNLADCEPSNRIERL